MKGIEVIIKNDFGTDEFVYGFTSSDKNREAQFLEIIMSQYKLWAEDKIKEKGSEKKITITSFDAAVLITEVKEVIVLK